MRKFLWMVALLCTRTVWADPASSAALPPAQTPFSSVSLPADTRVNGVLVSEISGLAWDPHDQALHAVSDSGHLFRFRVQLEGGALRAVVAESAVVLKHPDGSLGKPAEFDAEGLALRLAPAGDHRQVELLVATEGRPRVWRVDLAGTVLEALALPPGLSDAKRYQARNTMLEAVAVHPVHGLLVAPERPLRGEDPQQGHRIHALDRHWNIQALDPSSSRLKAMEVMESGLLLVLERSGSGKRLINALRLIDLNACKDRTPCVATTLLHIDRDGGSENYEGMAYLGRGMVLLASDNSGKKGTDTVFLLVDLSKHVPHLLNK